jgi:hypothetical protein
LKLFRPLEDNTRSERAWKHFRKASVQVDLTVVLLVGVLAAAALLGEVGQDVLGGDVGDGAMVAAKRVVRATVEE